MDTKRIHVLHNAIRPYAWGSHTAIAELLGRPSPSPEPQAELWMGAHPSAPSQVGDADEGTSLLDWIDRDPDGVLGAAVARRFEGRLPFLFKVLAAERPLSIQAHPNLEQARRGFAREDAEGIPRDAPERSYKDASHKPELVCALTRFQALKGFRPVGEIADGFEALDVPTLRDFVADLRAHPDSEGLRRFFGGVMTLPPDRRLRAVREAEESAEPLAASDPAHACLCALAREYPDDAGVLAPLYLNLVELEPGQALFLPDGELHSYLRGVAIEIMANSDNVLRGGLTPKHVDVPELLRTLRFQTGGPDPIEPSGDGAHLGRYAAPAPEFELSVLDVTPEAPCGRDVSGIEILLCTDGDAAIGPGAGGAPLRVERGTSLLVPAGVGAYRIEGRATLYRAAVPG